MGTPAKPKRKKLDSGVLQFIDDEAELNDDELTFSEDEDNASQMDELDASFINDASQLSQSIISDDSKAKGQYLYLSQALFAFCYPYTYFSPSFSGFMFPNTSIFWYRHHLKNVLAIMCAMA